MEAVTLIDLEGFYQLVLEVEKHREREDGISESQWEEGQWTQVETLSSCQLSPQKPEIVPKLPTRDICKQRSPGRCPVSV